MPIVYLTTRGRSGPPYLFTTPEDPHIAGTQGFMVVRLLDGPEDVDELVEAAAAGIDSPISSARLGLRRLVEGGFVEIDRE